MKTNLFEVTKLLVLGSILGLSLAAPLVPAREPPTHVRTSLMPLDLPEYKEGQVFRILADVEDFALFGDDLHVTHALSADVGAVDLHLPSPVVGQKYINGRSLDFDLREPAEGAFEFAVWDGKDILPPDGSYQFLVHLGIDPTPQLIDSIPSGIPYLVSPAHNMDSDASWLYWRHWRQSHHLDDGRWYAVNYGPLHLIVLDPSSPSAEQLEWLRNDLMRVSQPWIVALGSGSWFDQEQGRLITEMLNDYDSFNLMGIPEHRWYRFLIDEHRLEATLMRGHDEIEKKIAVEHSLISNAKRFYRRVLTTFSL